MWKRRAIRAYKQLFVRAGLYGLYRRLFLVSLWGLGVLNSENYTESGEAYFLARLPRYLAATGPLVIFDIGANVGDYAAQVKARHPTAELHAFEPHPATFAQLHRRAAAAGFTAHNLSLSDFEGTAALYNRPGAESDHASLYREVITEVHHAAAVGVEVRVTTVDAFVAAHGVARVHLLKIDAEGSELSILRGAAHTLAAGRIEAVQFEFGEMNVISRSFVRDFAALLPEHRLYRLLPDGLVPLDQQPVFVRELFAFQNIVALRAARP